jgi:SAM-dependent methyltransferase
VVRRIVDGLPTGRALDAACGTGRYTRYLVDAGHQVLGVDTSPEMLARARYRVPEATLAEADLHNLPVNDGSIDLVLCGLALAHIADLAPALAEFTRVLRPGGHVVLSDIHVLSLYLGWVAGALGPDGRRRLMPAARRLASDYLHAAWAAGPEVRACEEPRWPASDTAAGPPVVRGRGRRRLRSDAGRDHLASPEGLADDTSKAPAQRPAGRRLSIRQDGAG